MTKRTKKLTSIYCLFATIVGFSTSYADEHRSVGNVHWIKKTDVSAESLMEQNIPYGIASVFFLRENDRGNFQTSANIAINDRYQVSLQPNNYTQVLTCAGENRFSVNLTGRKSNDLLYNAVLFNLASQREYFFHINIDANTGAVSIRNINADTARNLLANKTYQSHQITRVVANCRPLERVAIRLEILFDNDKSTVKPQYFPELEQVADYMRRFPDASVTLEGHTDNKASASYNLQLSQRRVSVIKDILIRKYGIAENRILAIGYGETRPIDTNTTAEGRKNNRRVVAVFDIAQAH